MRSEGGGRRCARGIQASKSRWVTAVSFKGEFVCAGIPEGDL